MNAKDVSSYFSDQELLVVLTQLFSKDLASENKIRITARQLNAYSASHPSEIVECQVSGDNTLKVLCKYGVGSQEGEPSHRGDLIYESQVYEHILRGSDLSIPFSYGIYHEGNRAMLVIEYLENSIRGEHLAEIDAIVKAATWIARFHAANESIAKDPLPFLKKYDASYYGSWMTRTITFAQSSKVADRYPWLGRLSKTFDRLLPYLLAPSPTIIHGEYYPKNILLQKDNIFPVDWQSAAIACGEIDLASLTEGWPPEIIRKCTQEYKRVRWPDGEHTNFNQRFLLAQLYWNLRWLGAKLEWLIADKFAWRFDKVRSLAEQLNMI